ncbi:hypothetical protein SSBR45G_66770 [Bradyrhizobium sp. SSBR45G]|uniref:hypothetical protein n=1 Tax=unclassified Bradyrhizobium TaxID=2631580 RepID=UPI0023429E27|nr:MULTISPECIES: hypothetical protein [unclassified Bradyrhizobium]GLH81768.1 hypothetical protein SSBR45G_66770 [Bradyrhizobium sp. SSBR45G]GLH85629.1 hypothetical protein SSBR45R_30890 [Bradyrhizobium sp. SSBR45R]
MPILRYFLFVGGTLIALLVLADAVLPSVPLPTALTSTASDLPAIRIQSARKWPERIVLDTSTPPPAIVAQAVQPAPVAAAEPARGNPRDAFAQMPGVDTKRQVVATTAVEMPRGAAKISETTTKPADNKKRKTAKAHPGKPMILVAQQPHFGLFDSTW